MGPGIVQSYQMVVGQNLRYLFSRDYHLFKRLKKGSPGVRGFDPQPNDLFISPVRWLRGSLTLDFLSGRMDDFFSLTWLRLERFGATKKSKRDLEIEKKYVWR